MFLSTQNDIAMDLENEIRSMSDAGTSNGVDCEDEELTKLVVENQSLKHRLHILNKVRERMERIAAVLREYCNKLSEILLVGNSWVQDHRG